MLYEDVGRTAQKQRTRNALLAGARDLLARGITPTVEQVAQEAAVSRTTAYRYFPSQRELLVAAHPEIAATSLLPSNPSDDPAERLDAVIDAFTQLIIDTEAQQRSMLRLSLDAEAPPVAALPLRQGRAIGWIGEALMPLQGTLSDQQLHRLVVAIRSAVGIEALAWLTDVAGLSRQEAARSMRWSAQALLKAALTSEPPPR
jgi:AcrR family transcriptional regulator